MPKYQPPQGYLPHSSAGYHYKEEILDAPNGQRVRHIYYFNDETGEYTQAVYLLEESTSKVITKTPAKRKSKGRRALAVCGCVFLLLGGTVAGIRYWNTRDQYTPAPDEVASIVGIVSPEEGTQPTLLPYGDGSYQLPEPAGQPAEGATDGKSESSAVSEKPSAQASGTALTGSYECVVMNDLINDLFGDKYKDKYEAQWMGTVVMTLSSGDAYIEVTSADEAPYTAKGSYTEDGERLTVTITDSNSSEITPPLALEFQILASGDLEFTEPAIFGIMLSDSIMIKK